MLRPVSAFQGQGCRKVGSQRFGRQKSRRVSLCKAKMIVVLYASTPGYRWCRQYLSSASARGLSFIHCMKSLFWDSKRLNSGYLHEAVDAGATGNIVSLHLGALWSWFSYIPLSYDFTGGTYYESHPFASTCYFNCGTWDENLLALLWDFLM